MQVKMLGLLLAVFSAFGAIVVMSIKVFEPPNRQLFVGYLSVFSLISMFASPLFIIVSSLESLSPLLLFKYLSCVLLSICSKITFIAGFGYQNKERRIHAILPLTGDLFDESFFLRIQNVQAGSIYFCKCELNYPLLHTVLRSYCVIICCFLAVRCKRS